MHIAMSLRPWLGYINGAALLLLAALCIVGSFLGAEGARALFHTPAVVLLWLVLCVAFSAALLFDGTLPRRRGRLAAHAGCLLVILGSMLNSEEGHGLAARYLGSPRVSGGFVTLFEGQTSNEVFSDGFWTVVGRLDFSLGLEKFEVERYPLPASSPGEEAPVRAYTSRLTVIKNGREVLRKDVGVNHPLHFGGYHVYQYSWGTDPVRGPYPVFLVASDQGLMVVYAGFVLLAAGVFRRCWIEPAVRWMRRTA
jgi:hypothetical protein